MTSHPPVHYFVRTGTRSRNQLWKGWWADLWTDLRISEYATSSNESPSFLLAHNNPNFPSTTTHPTSINYNLYASLSSLTSQIETTISLVNSLFSLIHSGNFASRRTKGLQRSLLSIELTFEKNGGFNQKNTVDEKKNLTLMNFS